MLETCFGIFRSNQTYNLINMFRMNVLWNMNTGNGIQLCIFLVWCPSDAHLAILFVDYCKWLVYVASLLAPKPHLLLFFVLNKLDIVKTLPGCFLQTYIEEPVFFLQKKHRQQQHRIPFDAVAMKATASFIRAKITQDAWNMFWHFQVKIKHIIWQTFFTWMFFQMWIRAMEFSYVYFWSDATLLTLI